MVHRSQSARSTPAKTPANGSNLRATTSRSVDNLNAADDDDNQLLQSSTSMPDIKVGNNYGVRARRNSLNTVPSLKPPIGKAKKAAARKRGGATTTKTANKEENARLTADKLSPTSEAGASGRIRFGENNNEMGGVDDKRTASNSVQRNNKKPSTKPKNCDRKSTVPSSSSSSVSSTPNSSWLLNESSGASSADNTLDGLALMFDQKPDAIKICCSVALDRLPGILDTLPPKPKPELNAGQVNKSLCLYCDRSFGTQTLRLKHIERVHKATEGRRTSARTSSSLETSLASTQQWPGCGYCTDSLLAPKNTTLISDDLTGLFRHLIEKHADKYYACRPCSIRFTTDDQLAKHMKAVHQVVVAKSCKKPKSSIDESQPPQRTSAQLDFDDHIASLVVDKTDDDDEDVSIRVTRTSAKKKEMSAHDTMLHRLGLSHFRSPRTRKGAKNRRGAVTEGRTAIDFYTSSQNSSNGSNKSTRNSKSGRTSSISSAAVGASVATGVDATEFVIQKNRNEVLNCTFDEDFYDQVSLNVRRNLSCHLDGKLEVKIDDAYSTATHSPPIISPLISAIRNTTCDASPEKVDATAAGTATVESEIHEATSLPTVTAFPTLLTVEQFDGSAAGGDQLQQQQNNNKTKKPITKNSWKWKWDCVKKYKYVNEGGKIVKKVKQQQTGLRDLSKLDMWTQLAMRAKYESAQLHNSIECNNALRRQEKCKVVEQLNQILDTRLIPQINLEQDDQRVIKLEKEDSDEVPQQEISAPRVELVGPDEGTSTSAEAFVPELLNLRRNVDPQANAGTSKVILSGEWARPRCYICYQCGAKLDNSKALEDHKTFRHPHIYSTHYEIVGRELLERELYKYFFIPSRALAQQKLSLETSVTNDSLVTTMVAKLKEKDTSLGVEDSLDSLTSASTATMTTNSVHTIDTDTNTITSTASTQTRSSSRIANQELQTSQQYSVATSPKSAICTKCKREANGQLDLYRHMLDCSGDYAWILAKKRMKHRRAKKRRGNRGARSGSKPNTPAKDEERRKRLIEQRRSEHSKHLLQPKTRPGDAESIQRMLENLPPKRACRQILQSPTVKRRNRKMAPQKLVATKTSTTTTSKELSKVNIVKQTKKPTRRSTQIMRSMINSTKNRVTRSSLQILKNVDINKGKRKTMQTQKKLRKPPVKDPANSEAARKEVEDEKVQAAPAATVTTTTTISTTTIVQEIVEGQKEEEEEVLVDNKEARSSPKPAGKQPFIRTLQQNTKRMVKKITKPFKKPQKIRTTRNSVNPKSVVPVEAPEIAGKVDETAVAVLKEEGKSQTTSARNKIKKIVRKLSVRKTKTVRVEQTTTTTTTMVPSVDIVETKTAEPTEELTNKAEEQSVVAKDDNDPLRKMLRNFRRKKPVDEIHKNEPVTPAEEPKQPTSDIGAIETSVTTSPAIRPATTIPLTAHSSLPLYVHTTSTESINELTTPRSSGPPTSPLKTPPGKKKVKRINDCIAKLTGKLQEKMGVPFFDGSPTITSPALPVPIPPVVPEPSLQQPLDMSKKSSATDTWETARVAESSTPVTPIDENGCLDLSLPKKNRDVNDRVLVSPKLPNPAPQIIITPTAMPLISPPVNKRKVSKPIVPSVAIQPVKPKEILLENADNRAIIEKLLCNNVEVTQITGEQLINRRKSTRSELGSPTTPNTSVVSYTKPVNVSLSESVMNVAPENASTPNTSLGRSGHSKDSSIFLQNMQTGSSFTISPILPAVKGASDESGDRKISETRKILKESQFPASLMQVLQKESPVMVKPMETMTVVNLLGHKPKIPAIVMPLLMFPQPNVLEKVDPTTLPVPPVESVMEEKLLKPVKSGKKCKQQLAKDSVEPGDLTAVTTEDIAIEEVEEVPKTPATKKRGRKTKELPIDNTSTNTTIESTSTLSSINNSLINLTLDSANSTPEKVSEQVDVAKQAEPEKELVEVKLQEDEKKPDEAKSTDEPKEGKTPATTIAPTDDTSTEKPETKQRKRRKNELAKIIADQLLESFKEVDKSRIDELKVLHDLSIENNVNNDDLIVSTIRTTPIPRRKAAERVKDYQLDASDKARTASPATTTKSAEDAAEKKRWSKQQTTNEKVEGPDKARLGEATEKDVEQDLSKHVEDISKSGQTEENKAETQSKPIKKKTKKELALERAAERKLNSTNATEEMLDKAEEDTIKNVPELNTTAKAKPAKKKTKKQLAEERKLQSETAKKGDEGDCIKPVQDEATKKKTKEHLAIEDKLATPATIEQEAPIPKLINRNEDEPIQRDAETVVEESNDKEAVTKHNNTKPIAQVATAVEEVPSEKEADTKPTKKKTKAQLALERKSTTPVTIGLDVDKAILKEPIVSPIEEEPTEKEAEKEISKMNTKTQLALQRKSTTPVIVEGEMEEPISKLVALVTEKPTEKESEPKPAKKKTKAQLARERKSRTPLTIEDEKPISQLINPIQEELTEKQAEEKPADKITKAQQAIERRLKTPVATDDEAGKNIAVEEPLSKIINQVEDKPAQTEVELKRTKKKTKAQLALERKSTTPVTGEAEELISTSIIPNKDKLTEKAVDLKPNKKKTKAQLALERKSTTPVPIEGVEPLSKLLTAVEAESAEKEVALKPTKKKSKAPLALERISTTPVTIEDEVDRAVVLEEPIPKKSRKSIDKDTSPETPLRTTENIDEKQEEKNSEEITEQGVKNTTKQNKTKKKKVKQSKSESAVMVGEREGDVSPETLKDKKELEKLPISIKKKTVKAKQILVSDDEEEPPMVNIFADAPILTTKRRSRKDVAAPLQSQRTVLPKKPVPSKIVPKPTSKKVEPIAVQSEQSKMPQDAEKEEMDSTPTLPTLETCGTPITPDTPDTPSSDNSDLPLVRKGRSSNVARKLDLDDSGPLMSAGTNSDSSLKRRSSARKPANTQEPEVTSEDVSVFKTPTKRKTRQDVEQLEAPRSQPTDVAASPITAVDSTDDSESKRTRLEVEVPSIAELVIVNPKESAVKKVPMKPLPDVPIVIQRSDRRRSNREISELFDRLKQPDPDESAQDEATEAPQIETPFKVPLAEPQSITPPRRKSTRLSNESPIVDPKPANRNRKVVAKRTTSEDDDVVLVESDNEKPQSVFRPLKEPGFNLINQLDDSNNYFGNMGRNPAAVSVVSTLLDFNDETLFNDFDIEPTSKITDMVNDIIKNAELSESDAEDDDLCLADIAKGMNGKIFPSADDGDLLLGGSLQKISLPELESLSQSKQTDELASEGKCLPSPPETVPVIPSFAADDSLAAGDDEEETNTDIVDMDIDDDVSVITDCTLNRSASSQNSSGTRGKRRKYRRCVFVKSKRPSKAANLDASTGEEQTFDCDICKKTFRKADSLAKHKMTLTHIAKLSEQEFLRSELQKEADAKAAAEREEQQAKEEEAVKLGACEKSQAVGSIDALEKIAIEASLAVADVVVNAKTPDTRKSTPSRLQQSPKYTNPGPTAAIPAQNSPTAMRTPTPIVPNQSGIEPISSPEHLEPSSYAKYSVSTMRSTTAKSTTAAYDNARMALSQEEKLFFECCSMLKDSKPSRHTSSATSAARLPLQPNDAQYDTNERGAGVSNLVYSVKSPMSNSRSSPRPAFPKIDANQFSDISSDSNPIIFPGRNQYTAKHKIFTSIMNEDVHLPNFMSSAERYLNSFPSVSAMGQPEASQGATMSTSVTISQVPTSQNYAADSFSDDMGDSFPYSQDDVSESENFTQEPEIGATARSQTPLSSKNNSPAHSAASSGSEISKFRTKAALKGFENLKVSIPTTCLDLEQALLKSAESKLAALADIALMGSTGGTSDLNLKTPLDSALLPTLTSPKKPTAAKKNVMGNNLGFRVTKKNAKKSKATPVPGDSNDVYDFDEFADAEDGPEKSSFRSKPPPVEAKVDEEPPIAERPAVVLPQLTTEDSQQSATSYSDRDDCTFGVASPSTSNAEDGSDDSDSEESTGVSSMALSKRIKRSIAIEANIEQKKSLIWGRIFKKKEKVDEKAAAAAAPAQKTEPRDYDRMFDTLRQPGEIEVKAAEKSMTKPPTERVKKKPAVKEAPATKVKKAATPQSNDRRSKHVKNKNIFTEIIDNATIIPELKKSGRSREVAKLEAEWQMSVEEIEEIIGIGNRKSTRRCAAGKQKILAETWSSDDFEDFQGNTEDVIKMIETADATDEKKGGKPHPTSRSNSKVRSKKDDDKADPDSTKPTEPIQKISEESVKENILKNDETDDHDTATPTVKKATKKDDSSKSGATSSTRRKVVIHSNASPMASKKSNRKKTMRPKNIAYDSDSDFEVRLKTTAKPTAKPTLEKKRSPIKNRRKTTAFKEIKKPEPATVPLTSSSADSTPTKATTDKRGTHSDNETRVKFNLSSVGGDKKRRSSPGNPAMRRKRVASEMLYYWSSSSSDEEFGKISETAGDNEHNEEDEHCQQHGWIVGDHKKLVTLLAHAKGKKTDDGGVKESHRKKS